MAFRNRGRFTGFEGFTILELLVVVAIIAFLSSLSIVALSKSQQSSRDKQRQVDQLTIIKAVELYINDYGVPPTQIAPISFLSSQSKLASTNKGSTTLLQSLIPTAHAQADIQECGPGCRSGPGGMCICDDDIGGGGETCGNNYCACTPLLCLETFQSCPIDCRCAVNGVCEALRGETAANCPLDCASAAFCGNSICESGETEISCAADCGCNNNGACEIPRGETIANCAQDCDGGGSGGPCNNNAICEAENGENIENCSNDCYGSTGGGSSGSSGTTCDNDNVCDAGETPGSCPNDCTSSSMCYVNFEWDLCCLLGGTHCANVVGHCSSNTNIGCSSSSDCPAAQTCVGTAQGGYYGVCNGARCEQRYLLQRPSYSCSADTDCTPSSGAGNNDSNKFVPDTANNYLGGLLNAYIPKENFPKDPGGQKLVAQSDTPEIKDRLRHYWCSSHPDIVRSHRFCCYASMESAHNNIWPYPDLLITPTSNDGSDQYRWAVLCTT